MSMERMNGERGMSRKVAAGVVAFGVGVPAAVIGLNSGEGAESRAGAADTPNEWVDVTNNQNNCLETIEQAGTAETFDIEVNGETRTVIMPDIGAWKDVSDTPSEDTRLFTDGMRNPFVTGPEQDALETEVKASFCEDASFAVSTAHMIGNLQVNGQRLADFENGAWLQPYADLEAADINDAVEDMLGVDVPRNNVEELYELSEEHKDLAESLSAVLDNLKNAGVQVGKTKIDYSYDTGSAIVNVDGAVPEIVINHDQFDNAQALMFQAIEKGNECPVLQIGFNTGIGEDNKTDDGDQRPEVFEPICEVPETTTVPETTQPEEPTTSTTKPTTSTTRPTTSTTRPTTSTTRPTTSTTRPTTSTTRPGTTTTTGVTKDANTDPHGESPSTTVEAPEYNGDNPDGTPNTNPTTSTTAPESTTTTTNPEAPTTTRQGTTTTTRAGESTTTTEPASGGNEEDYDI